MKEIIPASYFKHHPFLWGAASAAYQVEGSCAADGRKPSVWDMWMDEYQVGGVGVSGEVAINFYDRTQYLQDIELFKTLGLNSYRFSISWTRIMPDGSGAVNQAGIEHYRQFIIDLRAAGIEPVMTLYHWDYPIPLYEKGGWQVRESVEWFVNYARVVFENFKDLVKIYVSMNELAVDTALGILAEDVIANREPNPFMIVPAPHQLERALTEFNHKLLASAAVAELFHSMNIEQGEIGIALPLNPTIAFDTNSASAAQFVDGVFNRWFLDALYKGTYPQDILNYLTEHGLDAKIKAGDAKKIQQGKNTFLGVNYYSPMILQADDSSDFYGIRMAVFPDTDLAFNGPNRPDQFERLLLRIKDEYGNPTILITENGAGFEGDDVLVNGEVNDVRRCNYLREHIEAVMSAVDKGVSVCGYQVWSSHDNLEWHRGYGLRFGMIYVDFDTQKRILKNSAKLYSSIIHSKN